MKLNAQDIKRLFNQKFITNEWPWNTSSEVIVDHHWKDILAEIRWNLKLRDKSEFGHYGSGYSSYVDSWLYREDERFRIEDTNLENSNCYWGLVVLYSRLSKYYVMGQGQKIWYDNSNYPHLPRVDSHSYLPRFDFVDHITEPVVAELVGPVEDILSFRGLVRLKKGQLSDLLDERIDVPTILDEEPFHHFDALFHWED